ncbi:uncharacterized protein LOC127797451 [Diospyros lotus]|uniref:uncharacterized protein LOC127797451 n=1 Tax=Diospyros lotus TaxID=55363 RepID=UPI0022581DF9|nr:uncharacterized protein LOC127797451 [Diospyros lotus]
MKKGKGVVVANHDEAYADEEYEVEDNQADFPPATAKFSTRNASSKYDFVKVKVWLGDNADHYYVLSRFLLSRMLTVTKIPNHVAIKIALELKKLLVDNSLLDVSQSDLEANLFKLMERRGYGEEYINRYKMMTRFHHQRVPLVILVCGTACVGKSTIATQLAQRLNLPNVLQTDMVYELLRTATDAPLTSSPVWARDFSSSEELITEFCRECRIVRKGLAGDLKKAMKDGKPIIIEGIHLDPSIYLMDDENKLPTDMQAKVEDPKSVASDEKSATQRESASIACGDQSENTDFSPQNCRSLEGDMLHKVSVGLESVDIAASVSDDKGETIKDLVTDRKPPVQKEKSGSEPIIIPIVLKMAEFDHKALLEEWISTRTFSKKWLNQDKDKLINNLKTIQDYLCSFNSQQQHSPKHWIGYIVIFFSVLSKVYHLPPMKVPNGQLRYNRGKEYEAENHRRMLDSSSEVTCLEQMRK